MTIKWTGERYVPGITGAIELEHKHRYVLATELAIDKVVLDVACGEGYGSAMLAKVAKHVIGIDVSPDAISHSNDKYGCLGIDFKVGTCSKLGIEDKSIDLVVSFETIEHHDQHHEMLSELLRVLKPEGLLLISSPDKEEYAKHRYSVNEFHVKELTGDEFKGLLKVYFNNINFYSQRSVSSSEIVPVDGLDQQNVRRLFSNERGVIDYDCIQPPLYHLALAGNIKSLPVLGASAYENLRSVENAEPREGLIRIQLFFSDSTQHESLPIDNESCDMVAVIQFDTRIHESVINFPIDTVQSKFIGVAIADQPCAIAIHELSITSPDGRILWSWDGHPDSFHSASDVVIVPAIGSNPSLAISFSKHPCLWLAVNNSLSEEMRGGALRLRCAGFTLFDAEVISELFTFIQESLNRVNCNQPFIDANVLRTSKLDEGLDDLLTVARKSLQERDITIREQFQQLHQLHDEMLRAEAQLDLLKDVVMGKFGSDQL
jgi:ubiquinone/menaquinone biosynthesis C-methylase UbiE